MLKTVQTVDEINYVSSCEVGVNGWKGETISTISTISVCALWWKYDVHIENNILYMYVKHSVKNKHISFGFILFRNITWA